MFVVLGIYCMCMMYQLQCFFLVDERDRAVEAKRKSEEEEKRRAEETSRLQEANRRLEAELEELRRGRLTSKASTSSMNSSVCPATPPPKSTDSASSQAAK